MAPTASGRFAPNHLSNPFISLNQAQIPQSHLQHAGPAHLSQSQGFGTQTAFGAPNGFSSGVNPALHGVGFGSGGILGNGGTGLGSHAAQAGFNQAGLHQQQQQAYEASLNGSGAAASGGIKRDKGRIREVWKSNLEQEMDFLRKMVDRFPYISMDTEFPGVVARPMGEFTTKASYHYQTLRCNVDLLKIIQLGITLFSQDGDLPPENSMDSTMSLNRHYGSAGLSICPCTWQFNFEFSMEDDMYNSSSIDMLKRQGADFERHASQGINPKVFASLLMTSGLALSEDVTWLSFHSGYDFAYLVKLMWNQPLPSDEEQYRSLVQIYFPNLYDVKYLLRHAQKVAQDPSRRHEVSQSAPAMIASLGTKSGLQDLADELGCPRIGSQHTAGSDALLTGTVYWKLRQVIFDGTLPDDMNGQMWGLTGVGAPASSATQAAVLAAQTQGGPSGLHVNGQSGGMSNVNASLFNPQHGSMGVFQASQGNRADGGPSTPTTLQAGLAHQSIGTPGPPGTHSSHGSGAPGLMTPQTQMHVASGGIFGQFQHHGGR